jgi:hypothetical protein
MQINKMVVTWKYGSMVRTKKESQKLGRWNWYSERS